MILQCPLLSSSRGKRDKSSWMEALKSSVILRLGKAILIVLLPWMETLSEPSFLILFCALEAPSRNNLGHQ